VRQVDFLQGLYRDARSTEYKISCVVGKEFLNIIFLYYLTKSNASKNPHADVMHQPIYSLIQFK
jgi:hypothetical protein